jgi:putative acetyltransferase
MTTIVHRTISTRTPAIAQRQPADIAIRYAEPEDAAALSRILSEPRVSQQLVDLPYTTLAKMRAALTHTPENRHMLIGCIGGEVAGLLALTVMSSPRCRHWARLGPIVVTTALQGRGVGTALLGAALDLADNWLNLARLDLIVFADNASAIALYRRFGFVKEATHRGVAFRNGQFADADTMVRLREAHH